MHATVVYTGMDDVLKNCMKPCLYAAYAYAWQAGTVLMICSVRTHFREDNLLTAPAVTLRTVVMTTNN